MKEITIVHLADMHVRVEQRLEFQKRARAFLSDIQNQSIIPDLVVISGDVSYSGKNEQYDIVQKELLMPMCKALELSPDKIIITMGNHDIDRSAVDEVFEKGVLATVEAGDYSPLMDNKRFKKIESAFNDFCTSNNYTHDTTRIFDFDGLKVGIAILNSTRICLSRDCSAGTIRIPIEVVNRCLEQIDDCAFKIATFHHPLSWFAEDGGASTIDELKHSFDIILNGHIHENHSEGVVSPNATYLQATASTFFTGTLKRSNCIEGYSIYMIDPTERKMTGVFRKYVYARHEYDKDTDGARDGQGEYNLPSQALVRQSNYEMLQQSGMISSAIKAELEKNRLLIQHISSPVYVEPNIFSVEMKPSGEVETLLKTDNSLEKHISVFYAVPDVGSTTFFQKKCCEINDARGLAFVVDAKELSGVKNERQVLAVAERKYGIKTCGNDLLEKAVLFVDEFSCNNSTEILRIIQLCRRFQKLVICVKNDILFHAMVRGNTSNDIGFYEFKYWRANKLKEFISKYISSVGLNLSNVDSAVRFIVHSFSHTDLPVTPFLVGMYLRIFFEGNGVLTSLNFVDLLERMESNSLSTGTSKSSAYSKHYYRRFLALVATKCQESQSLSVNRKSVETEFQRYIDKIGIEVDAEKYPTPLIAAGILIAPDEHTIGFSCYAFFRYYLAISFEGAEDKLLASLGTLGDVQSVGDAVPYYIHKHRDCKKLCDDIIHLLKANMPSLHEVYPEELDRYAKDILSPIAEKDSAEVVANRVKEINLSEEEINKDFESRQEASRTEEEYGLKRIPAQNTIDKVSLNIYVLRILYNVFRNLEEVEYEEKCRTLDEILILHLAGIMQMIELFSEVVKGFEKLTSLFAYLVAIWGSGFLSEHIASDTLKKVIREVHNNTKNPLKRFLLICIMAELGMEEYIDDLVNLVSETDSTSITEMSYYKIKECLVRCDKQRIPSALSEAFKRIYRIKAGRDGESKRKSDYVFNITISNIQKHHVRYWSEKLAGKTSDLEVLIQNGKHQRD